MDILSFLHLYTFKKRITIKYLIIKKDNTVSIVYIKLPNHFRIHNCKFFIWLLDLPVIPAEYKLKGE